MKAIIAISLALLAGCAGCRHPKTQPANYYENETNVILQTEFNQEQYIWENFEFSTNKVESL